MLLTWQTSPLICRILKGSLLSSDLRNPSSKLTTLLDIIDGHLLPIALLPLHHPWQDNCAARLLGFSIPPPWQSHSQSSVCHDTNGHHLLLLKRCPLWLTRSWPLRHGLCPPPQPFVWDIFSPSLSPSTSRFEFCCCEWLGLVCLPLRDLRLGVRPFLLWTRC